MRSRHFAAACVATILFAGAAGAGAEPLYTLRFLPTGFQGAQINDVGQIVGTASGAAAIYTGGGVDTVASSPSAGWGINNAGDIVGALNPVSSSEAFTYIGGALTNIHPLVVGPYSGSEALAINDHGVVGGNIFYIIGESTHGFLLHDGTVETIGTFGGEYSSLAALNNSGVATGYAAFAGPAGGYFHAYTYQGGTLQDLGTLPGVEPGRNSAGSDINEAGQVAGWSSTPSGERHPILYSGGVMTDLGTLGGAEAFANALNDSGVIVGESYIAPGDDATHAFRYADGALVDLNTLVAIDNGWQLTRAQDIDNAGQILATACQNGSCASVLLTPVPEPATGLMLLAGLALFALASRGRRPLPRSS